MGTTTGGASGVPDRRSPLPIFTANWLAFLLTPVPVSSNEKSTQGEGCSYEEWAGLQRGGWSCKGVGGATEEWVEPQRGGWSYKGVGGARDIPV